MPGSRLQNWFFAASEGVGQDGGVAKIELPESWAGVAEPLRALMAEVEREAHASSARAPDLGCWPQPCGFCGKGCGEGLERAARWSWSR